LPPQREAQLRDLDPRKLLRRGDVREQLAAEVLVGGLEDKPVDDSAHALGPEGCCASLRRVVSDGPLDHCMELVTWWLSGLHPGAGAASQQQCWFSTALVCK